MGTIHITGHETGEPLPEGMPPNPELGPQNSGRPPWAEPDHPIWTCGEAFAIDTTTQPVVVKWHVYFRGDWHTAPTLREAMDAALRSIR